jgi:Ni/Co efflux regulator RcnB
MRYSVALVLSLCVSSAALAQPQSAAEFFRADATLMAEYKKSKRVKSHRKCRKRRACMRVGLRLHRCTPAVLRNFVQKHRLKIVSHYRRGARIAGSRRRSLHSYCDGTRGAVDVRARRGIVRLARAKGFGVGTYSGRMHHIHLSVGGHETRFHKHVPRYKRYARRGSWRKSYR